MHGSCLSRAALLLSTNSTEDGSSIPTFTLVIPVRAGDRKKKDTSQKRTLTYTPTSRKKKKGERCSSLTYNTFLWRWRNDEALQRLLHRQLLKQTQEVAVAPPHCEGLALEHGQGRLKKQDDGWQKQFVGQKIIDTNRFVVHIKINGGYLKRIFNSTHPGRYFVGHIRRHAVSCGGKEM